MARINIRNIPNNRSIGWLGGEKITRTGSAAVTLEGRATLADGLIVTDGELILTSLPTTDPVVAGQVWDNGGVLEVSTTPPSTTTHRAAWFYGTGLTSDKLRVADSMRSGTRRTLQPGRALVLNGTNQYVSGPTAASPATWSAACWVYPLAVGAYDAIFSNRVTGINWYIGTNTSNQLYVAGDSTDIASGTTDFVVSTWQHLAVTYNGTTIKFYRNGVEVASKAYAATVTGGSVQMRIGYDQPNGSYYNARLSEVVWAPGQIFTPTEIAALHAHTYVTISSANGFFYKLDQPNSALQCDSSGNGNHGTVANWATGVHYEGTDVPYSSQNEVGFSEDNASSVDAAPNDFSGWSTNNITYSANQEYEPTGNTLVADRFLETTATGNHVIQKTITLGVTADGKTPWTLSFDVKGISRANWYVEFLDLTSSHAVRSTFNTSALTVTGATQVGSYLYGGQSIESLGGGWYRCKLTAVPHSGQTVLRPMIYGHDGSSLTYTGDAAKGFYIANVKLSKGSLHSPRNEATPTQDVWGNALEYTGQCPLEPPLEDSNCLTLNGSNQYVSVGTGTWDTDGTQAMEVQFWMKTTDTDASIISNRGAGAAYTGWEIAYASSQIVVGYTANNATGDRALGFSAAGVGNDGTWHHVRMTYDGTKNVTGMALYIDGIRTVLTAVANGLTGSTANAAVASLIGAATGPTNYFNGSLCDVRVTIGANSWKIPCSEGKGAYVHETKNNVAHLITNAGTNWSVLQPKFHANFDKGHRFGVNLFARTEELDNSKWVKSGSSITANTTTDPDSTSTADKLVEDSSNGVHQAYQNFQAPSAGVSYVFSVYAKKAERSKLVLLHIGGTSFRYDLATGTSERVGGSIVDVGGGWYRCIAVANVPDTANRSYAFRLDDGSSVSYAGNGTSGLYLWGAQLEVGSSASTYQRTNESPGDARVPASDGSTTTAANGLALTHVAGNWINDPETVIDPDCDQALATVFNGKTLPSTYGFDDNLAGTSLAIRDVTTQREDRVRILV